MGLNYELYVKRVPRDVCFSYEHTHIVHDAVHEFVTIELSVVDIVAHDTSTTFTCVTVIISSQ